MSASRKQTPSTVPSTDSVDALENFRNVLRNEAAALVEAANHVGSEVLDVANLMLECQGRVVTSGLGKSGFIARKAAATFCATGTPAIFLHPTEALHGDLGVVTGDDLFLVLSNSGETEELLSLLPYMARFGVPVISITGNQNSSLAIRSRLSLLTGVEIEAEQRSVTPTSSSTVMLAICDALAITLMNQRGFTDDHIAMFHPGGNLGRKLLLKVGDLMRTGEHIPQVTADDAIAQAIHVISEKGIGAVCVTTGNGLLEGILTDGDLRRALESGKSVGENQTTQPVAQVMTCSPKLTHENALAAEALKLMEDHQISVLPVCTADSQLVGVIHLHDLIRAGLA